MADLLDAMKTLLLYVTKSLSERLKLSVCTGKVHSLKLDSILRKQLQG